MVYLVKDIWCTLMQCCSVLNIQLIELAKKEEIKTKIEDIDKERPKVDQVIGIEISKRSFKKRKAKA